MKYLNILSLSILITTLFSCQEDQLTNFEFAEVAIDEFAMTQLLFSQIEYDLYVGDRNAAALHAHDLGLRIEADSEMYCYEEFDDIRTLVEDLDSYASKIANEEEDWSLDKLRDLKGQFFMLQTEVDYDPYMFLIWRFEEEMYYTTKAAMDPKLDLYEWGEFQMMVDCMNEDWTSVRLHYPSVDLFDDNELSYKIQTTAKIQLQESLDRFNQAVDSDDHITYVLCDHGEQLRTSYIRYIKTFVDQEDELEPFLAII